MPKILYLTALLALGACSAPAPDPTAADGGGRVATLQSAPPAAATSAPAASRPQLRLDTSEEEANRFWTAYDDCLVAHGVKADPVDQPGPAGPGRRLDQSGEPRSAYTACAGRLPRQPPELDEDANPKYAAQWNDHVKCLRAHGLKVHVTKPGEWTYDSSDGGIPANESQIEHDCLLEAFGHGS
ncbi:hypothetical protein ACWT_4064 [Actinoplanes sp. SE50]|uniref:hypothetical protein n=1 Tax=unclassified Actinoplanes TaxID=2626549 RepID=UPI00023EBD5A|nr:MULTISPECIES: hypothetical protein [unclassified Actinoplanes]AEV85088.1 hypothetical protein ACPL_4193 [Actinoplanes sp. SE50/110]ATO83479.1 hypothetical protein ACWT_4064 [Actinoplanes sp. SE50]SLM00886.1 hypothetical protein ACSP50_4119 [Actinoplanes sp. SE50/110]